MAIRLVAFDFDGTLVHTAPDIIRATNDFLELHGRPRLADREVMIHIGNGLVGLIRGVVPEAEHHPELVRQIEEQFAKIYDMYVLNEARVFDGVEEFLNAWPHKVAIVSNKPQRYLHLLLQHLGLNRYPWSAIIGGDTFPTCKPDPEPLRAAMAAAGVLPTETLMVGDGPPDVGVAAACGAHLLAVGYGYSPLARLRQLGAEHTIGEFRELADAIARIDSFAT